MVWIEVKRRIRKGPVREVAFEIDLEMKERGKQDKEIDFERSVGTGWEDVLMQ